MPFVVCRMTNLWFERRLAACNSTIATGCRHDLALSLLGGCFRNINFQSALQIPKSINCTLLD